jgi:hypothetical protein
MARSSLSASVAARPWRSRPVVWLAGVVSLAVLALIAAATIPGSHSGSSTFSVKRTAGRQSTADQLATHESKVFGSNLDAKTYGTEIGLQENEGVNGNGQLVSDLPPLPPAAFKGPIAAYRAYAERWAAKLARELPVFRAALASGAERQWAIAWSDYLHLGAVYGLLPGTLDHQIDGMPQNLGDSGPGTSFTGLHRIEKGLWTGAAPASLAPLATALEREVVALRRVLPGVQITPLDYATRAHEILEDAQRDLLSGTDVPWSGAGVLGTAAGLAATQEVIGTLVPLLQGRDSTLAQVQTWLGQLENVFTWLRSAHHGSWPTLDQLTTTQHERLNGTLAGALGALSLVPGTLETAPVPTIPSIPSSG